jgi:hypothetical protein
MEKETQNRINYLDITITKEHNNLTFDIYCKPTTTDSIIHNDSCHPNEHKKSATNYLINRMNTYPLTQENKENELTIINEILKNNGYQQPSTTCKHINKATINPTQTTQNTQKGKTKWATFTYAGPETKPLPTYFGTQTSKLLTKRPIQSNTT